MDVAPVKVLIAGNLRNGPSTSTPAEAAAGAPFTALSFWFLLGQAKRDTSVGENNLLFIIKASLSSFLVHFLYGQKTNQKSRWGMVDVPLTSSFPAG
ncbi:hypothetical protein, partial [Halalkalibaculum sp. DA384]|uniref:hypothetical protein n=1 Tax=Halalkalibaculum sp. DA384 TaxID=3373606 RepID=UPI0037542F20